MRKLSLAALTVLELRPEEMIDCAIETGYDGVGIRLIPATSKEPSYDFSENSKTLSECLTRLKDHPLKVTDIEILRLLPQTNIYDFEPTLAIGALMGAESALVAIDDSDTFRVQKQLEKLSDLAKQYGIMPHIEFMPWLSTNTLASVVDLLNPLDLDNISILIDTIHFNRSNSHLKDWENYRGSKPKYLQLCDTASEKVSSMDEVLEQARGNRKIPGEGYIHNMAEIVRTLPNDLVLSLEIPMQNKQMLPAKKRAQNILNKTHSWLIKHQL